ncbi:hypothetical protein B0J12DRAFT_756007 [Macrophomina phaseolina]|uniref:ubiquitinyl hydrolase 1 n=1 Tax=Macrophomina phaseolina TaxID=35725 RepID=A0ABQ8G7U0_9PEZI|nr:hypothetical protein B0J12DRAFT_756007 [Macrophomina phaseolina]
MATDEKCLEFIINHVVFPPKLPQQAEDAEDVLNGEKYLLRLVLDAAEPFAAHGDEDSKAAWASVLVLLKNSKKVLGETGVSQQALVDVLSNNLKADGAVFVHVREQNAGLLLRMTPEGQVIVDGFEASAENGAVMQTKGRLLRTFPGRSVVFPSQQLQEPQFTADLADWMHRLCQEQVLQCKPKSWKAGDDHAEERDTTHPGLVTENLMSILAAFGDNHDAPRITKNVRDEVNWQNDRLSWRRSPFWLVLRVSIQLLLNANLPAGVARFQYKNFTALLITRICSMATQHNASHDIRMIINVKAARRLSKLGARCLDFVEAATHEAVSRSRAALEMEWSSIQQADQRSIGPLPTSATEADTLLPLKNSSEYLQRVIEDEHNHSKPAGSVPLAGNGLTFGKVGLPDLSGLQDNSDMSYILVCFENWVLAHLDQEWRKGRSPSDGDCAALEAMMRGYIASAKAKYNGDAVSFSILLLVALEIWRVLDIICLKVYPLMAEYSPEIPVNIAEPLLLPHLSQMEKLRRIESHILSRNTLAKSDNRILEDPRRTSFCVKHYEQSKTLQEIRKQIENDASIERKWKEDQWKTDSAKYQSLINQAINYDHYHQTTRYGLLVHKPSKCHKCKLEARAASMGISVHEWPLPQDEVQAKATVFELKVPQGYAAWRDATWLILHDLGRRLSSTGTQVQQPLLSYSPLAHYSLPQGQRLSLGSYTKSFLVSHYRSRKYPVRLEEICVNNGLRYQLLDTQKSVWARDQKIVPNFAEHCKTPLPAGPYANLQDFVDTTTRSSNECVARQEECSSGISQHEFLSFASLRAGERLQWMNLLRELASSDLSLNTEAVYCLIQQAALQAGSSNPHTALRESHNTFQDLGFCRRLLELLKERLDEVKANWKEQTRVASLALLGTRLLSLSSDREITDSTRCLLRKIRLVVLDWCRELSSKLPSCATEESSRKLKTEVLRAALTCRMTYNIDEEHVQSILQDATDVACLVEATIYLNNNAPIRLEDLAPGLQRSLLMDARIACNTESRLRQLILRSRDGMNRAVSQVSGITGFVRNWTCVHRGPEKRWVMNNTTPAPGHISQAIHYNILTGELLVDGRPLGRLPREYTENAIYRRVFGPRILSVSTSDIPQMQYRSITPIEGYTIHLGLIEGELIIKAVSGARCLRAIPPTVWGSDFPNQLVQKYIHWMDISASSVEFFPLKEPWMPPKKKIVLHFRPDGGSTLTIGRSSKLVDNWSRLGTAVTSALGTIETTGHIIVTVEDEYTVSAALPRFGIKFFINRDGLLESKELAAVVEQDQSIGCLIGLQNKLILRSSALPRELSEKSVFVPYGKVLVSANESHRRVRIDNRNDKKVKFMHYRLDDKLRTLRGSPDVAATLYKAYLHAVTSSILPDPLTGHSGVHEALCILGQSSLRSSSTLSHEELDLLNSIASLTPHRSYYPEHLQVMQSVKWDPNLCQFIQNEDFCTFATTILSHAKKFAWLSGDPSEMELEDRGTTELHERAALRGRSALNLHLGCQERTGDSVYHARDADASSPRSLRIHEIASLIRQWPSQMRVAYDLRSKVYQWNKMDGFGRRFSLTPKSYTELLDFSVGGNFGALYDLCRSSRKGPDSYKLMFLFGAIAYGQPGLTDTLDTLLAIAFSGRFVDLMPERNSYDLSPGDSFQGWAISDAAKLGCEGFDEEKWSGNTYWERWRKYNDELTAQLDHVVEHVKHQWPCDRPSLPTNRVHLLNITQASEACASKFSAWYTNLKFLEYIDEVQKRLRLVHGPTLKIQHLVVVSSANVLTENEHTRTCPDFLELLSSSAAPIVGALPVGLTLARETRKMRNTSDHDELHQILDTLSSSSDNTLKEYAADFASSLEAFQRSKAAQLPQSIPITESEIQDHRKILYKKLLQTTEMLSNTLKPKDRKSEVLEKAGLWPRTTVPSFLACLSSKKLNPLRPEWKQALTMLGETVSLLQRAERLLQAFKRGDNASFYKEVDEPGRLGWKALDYPDWLLIELENNITIRHLQALVAKEMMYPGSDSNSVLQLNMGEGKSSTIVPMVTAALANGKQIARLIVLKPLLNQTQTLLSQRLGGLVDRPIYHVPFSRQTRLGNTGIQDLRGVYEECMREGGILVALPEHILSFRLMGREMLDQLNEEAQSMVSTEYWLQKACRDVLDESDEILKSQFQLIYSLGTQQLMDGQPDRWLITQSVLEILATEARNLCDEGTGLLEIDYRERWYPFISFLDPEAGNELLDRVVQKIAEGHLIGISFDHCSQNTRQVLRKFIQERNLSAAEFSLVEMEFKERPLWPKLHLLRGLIAYNVLLFVFQQKRWLVDFGLALDRCLMAVPYRAKGVPSLRAEFGHPDVAIALTCLSYYYSGLTQGQLRQSFDLLMRESDPRGEYARWVKYCPKLDPPLRSLSGVNLDDDDLWESMLYPKLKFSKAAADFFMSRVVFPHEAKEFPQKLSASAWDIPSQSADMLTTGFSGTNDNKFLLPLSIMQHDLPQLHGTNAMVVNLLLKQENRQYIEAKDHSGRRLSVEGLLRLICKQSSKIQVLIDVGAQVLESRNQDVAQEWLRLCPSAEAAIFFSDADEPMVVDREGVVERLISSAFSNHRDQCLVYLDEVHTRGIDLTLPTYARAAVTLGPRLTKDRLVQACMRMRKLGCHQSLVFLAPPEVHRGIRKTSPKTDEDLDSSDVVRWCLEQTCRATDALKPLWLAQGLEFQHRHRLSCELFRSGVNSAFQNSDQITRFYSDIQEPEGQTLEEMYGASANAKTLRSCLTDEEAQKDRTARHLLSIWNTFTPTSSGDYVLQEEQEREIAHEVEQEREVQRPPPAKPMPHELHEDVLSFVKTGVLPQCSEAAFAGALKSLYQTSAYPYLDADLSSADLLVTKDFSQTVQLTGNSRIDQFLRPVKWILSSTQDHRLVIISPHEANELLPEVKRSRHVRLHLYSARTSKAMRSFSDLRFFTLSGRGNETIPRPLGVAQLDIFAGCLFFRDYASYRIACGFLGLLTQPLADHPKLTADSDGFVDKAARKELGWPVPCPFNKTPLIFLREFVQIRRKGQAYAQTHLGHVVDSRKLTEESFDKV